MEEMIEAKVPPSAVWEYWEKRMQTGHAGKFKYKILNLQKGESFSILWKTLFVRLVFHHSVKPVPKGSLICYQVQIKGFFSPLVRWLLASKIQRNISYVLKAIVKDLESEKK